MQKIIAANGNVETVTPLSIVTWTADATANTRANASDRTLCILGEATGGAPGAAYSFSNSADASTVLGSGDLLTGVQYAFANGAPDGAAPNRVIAVNVRGGTPATYLVKDAVGKTCFTLQTLTYREGANQTLFSLSGDAASTYNLQIKDPLSKASLGTPKLGIGLYIQYVGGGSAATVSVVTSAGTKYLQTTITGGNPGESLMIPLTGITVEQLARQIQQSGPYNVLLSRTGNLMAAGLDETAAPVDIMGYHVLAQNSADAPAGTSTLTLGTPLARNILAGETLRFTNNGVWYFVQTAAIAASGDTTLSIKPVNYSIPANVNFMDAAVNAPVALSAVAADFQDFLSNQGLAVVNYIPGDPEAGLPVAQGGNFTGGGSMTPNISDWETALEHSLNVDYGSAVALTDNQGVVFAIRARLQQARRPEEGKFIQLFCGVDSSLLPQDNSDAAIVAFRQNVASYTATVNDRDSIVVSQATTMINPQTGLLQQVKPYFTAAKLAGYAASIGRAESLTYASISATNPFPNLRTHKDDFTLIGTTVLIAPSAGRAARVELGRTAYVGSDNTVYESEKMVRLMNSVARDVKAIQEQMIPGQATTSQIGKYKVALTNYFEGLLKANLIQAGYDANGAAVDAYTFSVGRTQYQGRLVTTTAVINPTGEFVVGDFYLKARPVEIQV